jgi:hypothetical protein
MEHYSMDEWIDFARGVVKAADKATLLKHLELGCRQCSDALNLWQHVHQIGRQEQALDPPESAVRAMKGAFAIHGPRRQRRGAVSIARLLFDSAMSPAQAGVRSTASPARQLLFGVGAYRIDLRMEPQPDTDKVAVIGQVLHSEDPGEALAALPVALVRGRKVVAETVTSRFGEFNLECDLDGRFHLRVKLPSEELQFGLIDPLLPPSPLFPLTRDSKEFSRIVKHGKKRTKGKT